MKQAVTKNPLVVMDLHHCILQLSTFFWLMSVVPTVQPDMVDVFFVVVDYMSVGKENLLL